METVILILSIDMHFKAWLTFITDPWVSRAEAKINE